MMLVASSAAGLRPGALDLRVPLIGKTAEDEFTSSQSQESDEVEELCVFKRQTYRIDSGGV